MGHRHRNQMLDEADEPEVNLTPLIDVVFVVLIVFILVAPMLEVDKIDLAPGNSKETVSALDSQHPITIRVDRDDKITLNNNAVVLEHLPTLLMDLRVRHPDTKPQLLEDSKASFGVYQQIKNAAEFAGFTELDVILKPS